MLLDDGLGFWQPVEEDLREKVVFGLVLHTSHQEQPYDVVLGVVPAGYHLVVHKAQGDLLVKSMLSFVISDQNVGRVKPSNQISNHKVQDVATSQYYVVVNSDEGHFGLG